MVTVVRLMRIFRQAMGSAIVTNAHKINHGEYPVLKGGKTVTFSSLKKRTRKRL